MAEVLKQLKIKTAALNRLKKEYQSYQNEIKTQKEKISLLPAGTQNQTLKISKQTEFLLESQSVLSNVKHKLIDTYEDLDLFVKQKGATPDVNTSAEKMNAVEMLDAIEQYLENLEDEDTE